MIFSREEAKEIRKKINNRLNQERRINHNGTLVDYSYDIQSMIYEVLGIKERIEDLKNG